MRDEDDHPLHAGACLNSTAATAASRQHCISAMMRTMSLRLEIGYRGQWDAERAVGIDGVVSWFILLHLLIMFLHWRQAVFYAAPLCSASIQYWFLSPCPRTIFNLSVWGPRQPQLCQLLYVLPPLPSSLHSWYVIF
jgi:hypothetical protein